MRYLYLIPTLFATLCKAATLNHVDTLGFSASGSNLQLGGTGLAPTIRLDSNDWPGVIRAAGDVALDFGRVLGTNGTVLLTNSTSSSTSAAVIIAGTIGKSSLIDALISSSKIDVSAIKGKWESYSSQVVSQPMSGVSSALVIAGSDKRGTIYGLYDISEQIGVSPWYWWADVPPKTKTGVWALPVTKIQGPPSVQYRGIFLNDEAPALSNWVTANYPNGQYGAGYNANFYAKVFELLLRLRANYLWPAMWDNMFYVDDSTSGPLADRYGIVMGTSHTEPMARATKEQGLFNSGTWDWTTNKANVKTFMQQGVTRAKSWETLWTLGMRGEHDTGNPNITAASLTEIISYQQSILKSTLVSELTCSLPGSRRVLSARDDRARNYKWINTIQLVKTWEQMHLAYERQARKIWIVNVGDLKPLEIPITHFFDMAYNMQSFSSPDSTAKWLKVWAAGEFNSRIADATAAVITTYGKLIARRKYELLSTSPFALSVGNYDEAETVLR
ncbi:9445_t:CDS:2, partial [Acaulospora colombiana]